MAIHPLELIVTGAEKVEPLSNDAVNPRASTDRFGNVDCPPKEPWLTEAFSSTYAPYTVPFDATAKLGSIASRYVHVRLPRNSTGPNVVPLSVEIENPTRSRTGSPPCQHPAGVVPDWFVKRE